MTDSTAKPTPSKADSGKSKVAKKTRRKIEQFPYAAVRRCFAETGIQQISEEAIINLDNYLFKEGERIAKKSCTIATHTKRKTVQGDDVKVAIEGDI